MALGSAAQRRDVQSGTLDVGRLFTPAQDLPPATPSIQ